MGSSATTQGYESLPSPRIFLHSLNVNTLGLRWDQMFSNLSANCSISIHLFGILYLILSCFCRMIFVQLIDIELMIRSWKFFGKRAYCWILYIEVCSTLQNCRGATASNSPSSITDLLVHAYCLWSISSRVDQFTLMKFKAWSSSPNDVVTSTYCTKAAFSSLTPLPAVKCS